MRDWLHAIVPSGLTIVLLLMLHGAVSSLAPSTILPNIVAIMVLFWAWYRPALMPSFIVFLLGLLQDALSGTPLGLHALTLLLMQFFVLARLRNVAESPFLLQWFTAWLVLGGELVVRALIGRIWLPAPLVIEQIGLEWVVTALAYPLFHVLCGWIYEALPRGPLPRGRG